MSRAIVSKPVRVATAAVFGLGVWIGSASTASAEAPGAAAEKEHRPIESAGHAAPAPSPPADVARIPAGTPPPVRLAWVNPSRCLVTCGADPASDALRRLDERGEPAARGKYRVASIAVAPVAALLAAARGAGFRIRISSAFRSYRDQARMFRSIKERGRAARPGHSEHQLGTAIDLRLPSANAIDWLAEHAFEHGFAVSYPPGKQRLTGYRPEPWHVRFVGHDLAGELHQRGWTLEEMFRARPDRGESGSCGDCPAAISRAGCGAVTPVGECRGTVLTWCYDGSLAAVDCAVSNQTCNRDDGSPPDCR